MPSVLIADCDHASVEPERELLVPATRHLIDTAALARELARHPRAIVTPHAAWRSRESEPALKTEVAREALRAIVGRRPRSPANEPSAGD